MEFLDFMNSAVTQYQAVETITSILLENNFKEIHRTDTWNLQLGGKYFFTSNDAGIIAFTIGNDPKSFRIINSHGDSPTFRVKSKSQLNKSHYISLNTEIFGSPILSSWMDRPLSIAGRVYTKTDDPFKPKKHMVNIDRDLLVIPNAAIHLNRDINDGYKYKPHIDMLPLLGTTGDEDAFMKLIADEIDEDPSLIYDYDLQLYSRQKATYFGLDNEFISSGRLDNLEMAYCSVMGLLDGESSDINLAFVAGNEEIGSMGLEGADSPLLSDTLRRISKSLELDNDIMMANSFVVSADASHAIHPNLTDLSDPTNFAVLNQGPVIKYSGRRSYMSDGYSGAVFKAIADNAGVSYQYYTNRSDQRGGVTIGPINTNHLSIPVVDVGNPTLAMHSASEVAGRKDLTDMLKIFKEFYK